VVTQKFVLMTIWESVFTHKRRLFTIFSSLWNMEELPLTWSEPVIFCGFFARILCRRFFSLCLKDFLCYSKIFYVRSKRNYSLVLNSQIWANLRVSSHNKCRLLTIWELVVTHKCLLFTIWESVITHKCWLIIWQSSVVAHKCYLIKIDCQ
jgi:hypothetical protein